MKYGSPPYSFMDMKDRLRILKNKCIKKTLPLSGKRFSKSKEESFCGQFSNDCMWINLAYIPPKASSCSWVPCSMILPWLITTIKSAF